MGRLRYWIRKAEKVAKETSGEIVLIDELDGQTYSVPKDAFALMVAAVGGEEPDPAIEAILPTEDDPDRLERLYYANSGEPFWVAPTLLMNAEESYEE